MMTRNTKLYEVAKTIKNRDVIKFTSVMKTGSVTATAVVIQVNHDERHQTVDFSYLPCNRKDSVQCGFGVHFISAHDNDVTGRRASPWGWQDLEIVGTEKERSPTDMSFLYKNPSYDLVNI